MRQCDGLLENENEIVESIYSFPLCTLNVILDYFTVRLRAISTMQLPNLSTTTPSHHLLRNLLLRFPSNEEAHVLLVLFGWRKCGEEELYCCMCHRKLGLWNFKSRELNPCEQHRPFCLWVHENQQQEPAWTQILKLCTWFPLHFVSDENHLEERSERVVLFCLGALNEQGDKNKWFVIKHATGFLLTLVVESINTMEMERCLILDALFSPMTQMCAMRWYWCFGSTLILANQYITDIKRTEVDIQLIPWQNDG